MQSKKKHERGASPSKMVHLATRVEKEYLKPSYTASIGEELEDGLFDGKNLYCVFFLSAHPEQIGFGGITLFQFKNDVINI